MGEREDRQGVKGYEAYEVKNKRRENYAAFYFAGKRIFFNICNVIVLEAQKKAPLFTTCAWLSSVRIERISENITRRP